MREDLFGALAAEGAETAGTGKRRDRGREQKKPRNLYPTAISALRQAQGTPSNVEGCVELSQRPPLARRALPRNRNRDRLAQPRHGLVLVVAGLHRQLVRARRQLHLDAFLPSPKWIHGSPWGSRPRRAGSRCPRRGGSGRSPARTVVTSPAGTAAMVHPRCRTRAAPGSSPSRPSLGLTKNTRPPVWPSCEASADAGCRGLGLSKARLFCRRLSDHPPHESHHERGRPLDSFKPGRRDHRTEIACACALGLQKS